MRRRVESGKNIAKDGEGGRDMSTRHTDCSRHRTPVYDPVAGEMSAVNFTVGDSVLTAVVVGFSAIEEAGMHLLLAEHGFTSTSINFDEYGSNHVPCDVVILDLSAFDPTDAADADRLDRTTAALRDSARPARVLGVCASDHSPATFGSVRAIDTVVDRSSGSEVLVRALVDQPVGHRSWRPSEVGGPVLTPRERDVLELVAGGCTSKVIAAALGVSVHTVERHKQRLFRRLDVQNQAQAVAAAVRVGLLEPGAARSIAS